MVVAVQSNLVTIGDGLRRRGYTVVNLYTYKKPVDAVVYEGRKFDFSLITDDNVTSVMSTDSSGTYGVFIICANGKSIDEIDQMLKTRRYSSFV